MEWKVLLASMCVRCVCVHVDLDIAGPGNIWGNILHGIPADKIAGCVFCVFFLAQLPQSAQHLNRRIPHCTLQPRAVY